MAAILPALALTFPSLTGRVVDEAGIIDRTTQGLFTSKLADLETKTTDQFVVVTLRSLQGTTIEDFGVQLGRHWGIGQRGKNNGVLLIVAPAERKVRIEVGYGLEGSLTDAVTKLIIETSITPRFRAGDMVGGIARGVDDIIQVLTGDAEEWKRRAAQRAAPSSLWFILIVTGVALIVVVIIVLLVQRDFASNQTLPGGRRRRDDSWLGSSGSGSSSWGSGSSGGSGGFSGGGGSFGGGGSSGSW